MRICTEKFVLRGNISWVLQLTIKNQIFAYFLKDIITSRVETINQKNKDATTQKEILFNT